MFSQFDINNGIKTCLENTGSLVEEFDEMMILKEVIFDSLALVTFEIELENYFDVEIPAEKFSKDWMNFSFKQIGEILKSCL